MRYFYFYKTIYSNCKKKKFMFVCKIKSGSRLDDYELGLCIGRVVQYISKLCWTKDYLCDCSFYFKTPSILSPCLHSHSDNQKPSQIFLKHLIYGTVPIEIHCYPVFLRQSSIRGNWTLECRNQKCFSIVVHFIFWRPGVFTLFSSLSTPISDSWSGFLSPSVVLVCGTILEN